MDQWRSAVRLRCKRRCDAMHQLLAGLIQTRRSWWKRDGIRRRHKATLDQDGGIARIRQLEGSYQHHARKLTKGLRPENELVASVIDTERADSPVIQRSGAPPHNIDFRNAPTVHDRGVVGQSLGSTVQLPEPQSNGEHGEPEQTCNQEDAGPHRHTAVSGASNRLRDVHHRVNVIISRKCKLKNDRLRPRRGDGCFNSGGSALSCVA